MNQQIPKAYFVADAHLGSRIKGGENREAKLVEFLSGIEAPAQLFIVGDLFEFWFEYKYLVPKGHEVLLGTLRTLSERGVSIQYVAGNHDFALGPYLPQFAGITIHWHAFEGVIQGRKVFVSHGDGLWKRDVGYRMLKPLLRSRINQWLYRLLPADAAIRFARFCSGASRYHTRKRPREKVLQAYRDIGRDILARGYDIAVMGHTHTPEITGFGSGVYVNVGAWICDYPYAIMENGAINLKYFT